MSVAHFWHWLEERGYRVEEPRPRLDPALEAAIEEELVEEEAHGEREPDSVPELVRNVRLVRKDDRRLLLYAIDSATEQGLWGIGVNEIAELRQQPLPWVLILFGLGEMQGTWIDGQQAARASSAWKRFVPDGLNYGLRPSALEKLGTAFKSAEELSSLLERQ